MPSQPFTIVRVVSPAFGSVTIYGHQVPDGDEVIYLFEPHLWPGVLEALARSIGSAAGSIELIGLVVCLTDEKVLEVVELAE